MKNNINYEILKDLIQKDKISILIVDDSSSVNAILYKKFLESNFNCYSSKSLSEARKILNDTKIDYILLDIHLPDGNGYELIKELENTKNKIFVLTSEKDMSLREASFQKGVIDYIFKDQDFFKKLDEIANTIIQIEKNKYKNILVVDDSVVIQEQLKALLNNRNYNVIMASSIKETLDILSSNHIHLILLDIQLKDGSGLIFLNNNKTEIIIKRKIPVMIISGNVSSQTMRDSLKAGAVDVIKKPYIIEEVILKVDMWIEFYRKEQENYCFQALLQQYKETVDRSSIVSKTDRRGRITYVNDEFCKISGYIKDELLGKNHNIVRHSDMDAKIFENLWDTIKVKKVPWQGKVKNKKKNGDFYWVDTIINPILDAYGNIVEFIAIRKDITEQVLIEEYFKTQLETTETSLDEILRLSKQYELSINESNILSRTSLNGTITYVNDKFSEITGYSKEEVMGKNHNIVRHPDTPDSIFDELWKIIKSGNTWKGILKNKTKNGKSYWVDTTIIPIKDKNEQIIEFMAIRHDLTELFELHKEIEDTQKEVIYKMGEIGETRSKETGNHVKRVAEYSKLLGLLYGLSEHESNILYTASPMHDIGKVGISDSILKKPAKLTDEEFDIMRTHSEIGFNILKGSNREVLKAAAITSHEHHEKWDGSGYPKGLKEEEIHIFGRITAIADVFDALGSVRCYKDAWEDEKIFKLLKDESGKHFDPKLIELFFENFEQFDEIRNKYKD